MIIDCHTHWGMCWADRDGDDPSRWLAALDAYGIDRAFLMGHAGMVHQDRSKADNDTVARIAAKTGGRLIPIASAWPQMGRAGVDEVRRCVEHLGMKGLKLHPWLQGFSTADPVLGDMCGLAGELNVPVFFHDGTPCYSLSEQIAGLARRFPSTTFVLGHAGLLWNWRSALEACRQPNVWICLCGPHRRAMETLCDRADPDRIVWGTDYGFGFADSIRYRLGLIRSARIAEAVREKVLGVNALRLLRQ